MRLLWYKNKYQSEIIYDSVDNNIVKEYASTA